MNIVNDKVVFANADLLGFSVGMRDVIIAEIGVGRDLPNGSPGPPDKTPAQFLSQLLNQRLTQFLERHAVKTLPSLSALQTAFVTASAPNRLAAKAFLDQAKAVLGVVVTDPVIP